MTKSAFNGIMRAKECSSKDIKLLQTLFKYSYYSLESLPISDKDQDFHDHAKSSIVTPRVTSQLVVITVVDA